MNQQQSTPPSPLKPGESVTPGGGPDVSPAVAAGPRGSAGKLPKFMVLVIVVFVILALLVTTTAAALDWWQQSREIKSAEAAFQTYVEDLKNEDIEAAYAATSQELQSTTPKDQFRRTYQQAETQAYLNREVRIVSTRLQSQDGQTLAVVEVASPTAADENFQTVHYLVKQDDRWLVTVNQ